MIDRIERELLLPTTREEVWDAVTGAGTQIGGMEALGLKIEDSAKLIAGAITELADAVRAHAGAERS